MWTNAAGEWTVDFRGPCQPGREGLAATATDDGTVCVLGGFHDTDGGVLGTVEAYATHWLTRAGRGSFVARDADELVANLLGVDCMFQVVLVDRSVGENLRQLG